MKQELQLGKYEFYPYEFEKETTDNLLEEFKKMLKDCKRKEKTSLDKSAKSKKKE